MNTLNRERLLMTLLPVLLLTIVWFGWKRHAYVERFVSATASLTETQAAAPDAALLLSARQRKLELAAQDATAGKQRDELIGRWRSLQQDIEPVQDPAQTIERVSALLKRNRLNVLKQQLALEGNGGVARSFTRFAEKVRATQEWEAPAPTPTSPALPLAAPRSAARPASTKQHSIWRIELAGTYAQVQAALKDLAREMPHETVVQVSMAEADPSLTLRSWTLILAM